MNNPKIDLPIDSDSPECGILMLRSEHAITPFDDIIEIEGIYYLMCRGRVAGTLTMRNLARFGVEA